MSRADIADFLGLTTETVSRTFSQLRKSRIIALDGVHTVVILRPRSTAGTGGRKPGLTTLNRGHLPEGGCIRAPQVPLAI